MKRKSDNDRNSSVDKYREKRSKDRGRDRGGRDRHRSRSKDRRRSKDRKRSRDRHRHSRDRKDHKKSRKRSRSSRNSEEKGGDRELFDMKKEADISNTLTLSIQNSIKDTDKSETSSADGALRKGKKSRWSANELDKCVIVGMPTTLPSNMKTEDADVYVIQLEIAEINNKLKKQNYTAEIEAMSRLPSPDPVYGHDGKRINTKEYRARERLEDRRRQMMEKLAAIRPELVPQNEKSGIRYEEKVYIPQEDYPDINFAGLIIGPRGMTQKDLEKETGTRIILRGKGSVKSGKISINANPLPGEDEPLHAFITSFSKENVQKGVDKINKIIKDGIEFPELENDLRKNQMKQLAILNGTYRETEGLNKLKMLSEAATIATNNIICSLCGGTGHLPRDCKMNHDRTMFIPPPPPTMAMPGTTTTTVTVDGEYKSFMTELGPDAQVGSYYLMPQEGNNITYNEDGIPANSFVKKFVFNN